MKWTVVSVGNADDELTDIWLRAENQKAITGQPNESKTSFGQIPTSREKTSMVTASIRTARLRWSTKLYRTIGW
jgi:hypothetical protein